MSLFSVVCHKKQWGRKQKKNISITFNDKLTRMQQPNNKYYSLHFQSFFEGSKQLNEMEINNK